MNTISEDKLDEFRTLWDGSESWILWRSLDTFASIIIRFAEGRVTLKEILAIRQLLPQYQNVPLSKVKAFLEKTDELIIKNLSVEEAQRLTALGQQLGLNIVNSTYSRTSYLPVTSEDNSVCIIEDNELAEQVYIRMINAGVPIVDR